ncbi:hypothetical protein ABI023_14770, partial [Enterococcus faecium]|uniref:hypothetical protein n=1 Tax=Enterococcus faecium TaxID=1352 RepID=UPI003F43B1DE
AGPHVAASDRIYLVQSGKLTALDYGANEYLTRSLDDSASLIDRARQALGSVDDAWVDLIDPDSLAGFLGPFRSLTGWKVVSERGGY